MARGSHLRGLLLDGWLGADDGLMRTGFDSGD